MDGLQTDTASAEIRFEVARAFAYGAGHEINNPLANIAARAQALLVDERDPERRRKLATIVDQAFRARDMIGGLMVFARPPAPRLTPTDVHDAVRPVVEAVRAVAAARGVRLEYNAAPVPLVVLADAAQIGEALRAIVLNALEAVDEGGRVVVEVTRDAAAGARVVVVDDGPGMDSAAVRAAFDPFYSGRDAGRGIGLGLPKAQRLVEINGGRLAVESRPSAGTRVLVDLPAA